MEWYIAVLKKYAVFEGRSRRKEYWFFVLFNLIISLILALIDNAMGNYDMEIGIGTLGALYALAVLIPAIAVSIRRLHDTNRRGWWVLLPLIPLIGALVLLFFLVQDSTPGSNRFGPNPKGT